MKVTLSIELDMPDDTKPADRDRYVNLVRTAVHTRRLPLGVTATVRQREVLR